jgi:hypothetical protein
MEINNKVKAVRYVVKHTHDWHGHQEEAFVSYNTALTNALSLAIHTASRYGGEIFADDGNGNLELLKSYIRKSKV